MRRLQNLADRLAHPRAPFLLAAVAIVLSLPSLFGGFALDDHYFRMVFQGSPGLPELDPHPLETFTFGGGTPETNRVRMNRGLLPWWTPMHWQTSFWRPVTSVTHRIDHQLFGNTAWPMHLHSVLLYGLLVLTLVTLYRRLCASAAIAGLAALLFIVDDANALPVGWLSSRNTLLSAIFAVLTLLLYDQWRRVGKRWAMPSSLVALVLALLSGEGAVAVTAYLFAYAVFIEKTRPRVRLLSLLPYAVAVIAWRLVYTGLGYGAANSLVYVDPGAQPAAFLSNAAYRWPAYLFGLFGMADPFMGSFLSSPWIALVWALMVTLLAFALWVIWPVIRNNDGQKFWLVGSVLAVAPACATYPQSRLLMFAAIGAMPVIAHFLYAVATREEHVLFSRRWPGPARVLTGFFIFAHLIVAPVCFVFGTISMLPVERVVRAYNASIPSSPEIRDRKVIVVRSALDVVTAGIPILRSSLNQPVPESTWQLVSGFGPLTIERVDAHTLVVRTKRAVYPHAVGQVFARPPWRDMQPGEKRELDGLTIEVLRINRDGRPKDVRFEFAQPLESPDYHWLTMDAGRYVPFELPAVGDSVELEPIRPVRWLPRLIETALFGYESTDSLSPDHQASSASSSLTPGIVMLSPAGGRFTGM